MYELVVTTLMVLFFIKKSILSPYELFRKGMNNRICIPVVQSHPTL